MFANCRALSTKSSLLPTNHKSGSPAAPAECFLISDIRPASCFRRRLTLKTQAAGARAVPLAIDSRRSGCDHAGAAWLSSVGDRLAQPAGDMAADKRGIRARGGGAA